MREVPHLVQIGKQYESAGLVVVGVTQVDSAAAEKFQVQRGAHYPLLADATETFEAYGIRKIPEVFLKDPEGRIVAQGIGFVDEYLSANLKP